MRSLARTKPAPQRPIGAGRRALRSLIVVCLSVGLTIAVPTAAAAVPAHHPGTPTSKSASPAAPYAFDPFGKTTVTNPHATSAPHADSAHFVEDSSLEVAQGPAFTAALPAGDSLEVHQLGVISRVNSMGGTVWQRGDESLLADWRVTYNGVEFPDSPQVPSGGLAADPMLAGTDDYQTVKDDSPYAIGNLTGGKDGDIAVAETVGINLGVLGDCNCLTAFTVPGSDLHYGSFVTVLGARTGKTEYSVLEPGIVTQLAISDGRLLIGDETGEPTKADPAGQWGSFTNVHAITVSRHGQAFAARTVWTYSTRAQWARLFGMQEVAGGGTAIAWSDTPMGLGVPGPPDGHVLLLNASGHRVWSSRTSGYPVLSRYDPTRDELAVVEQLDPVRGAGYTMLGVDARNGRQLSAAAVAGVLPIALTVGRPSTDQGTSWVVAGVHATSVHVPGYESDGANVRAFNPKSGSALWSMALAANADLPPVPAAVAVVPATRGPATVLVTSWTDDAFASAHKPDIQQTDLQGLRATDGQRLWDNGAQTPDPLSALTTAGTRSAPQGSATLLTEDGAVVRCDVATGAITRVGVTMTDLYAVAQVGDGADVIAAGQSGGVYRLDTAARTMSPQWRADAGGPVHQLVSTRLGSEPVVVAAATTGIATFDENTGRAISRIPLRGSFVWNVSVGGPAGDPVIVTGTDTLSGYDLATGRQLWTYKPAAPSYFSDVAVVGDVAVSEFEGQVQLDEVPTGLHDVGVDLRTGTVRWAVAPSSRTVRAQLQNGVAPVPTTDGTPPTDVAFTWETSDGSGAVEVRDAAHGTMRYLDSADELDSHVSYQNDGGGGLIGTGTNASAAVTPNGAVPIYITGTDGAVARVNGTPMLINADVDLAAYPASLLAHGGYTSTVAEYAPFEVGHIVVLPSTSGTDKILTTSDDPMQFQVLRSEAGLMQYPQRLAIARGLAVQHLPATAAAIAATRTRSDKRPAKAPAPTTDATGADVAHLGVGVPDVRVRSVGSSGNRTAADDPTAYVPTQIRSYLHITGDGEGQTIAIVDAGNDTAITADTDHFSQQFGLPRPCAAVGNAAGCFRLDVSAPDGRGAADASWAIETALDVEWAHAIAPRATIRVVLAAGAAFNQLFSAVGHAASGSPDVISMSWGKPGGEFTDETYYDHLCKLSRTVCVVSSGDSGYPGGYPAYNPAALSVGGTTLTLGADGSVTDEQAWAGSGGGKSYVEPRPDYQSGAVHGGRGLPDVSFDADPQTGVAVYDSVPYQGRSGWFQVGGTSLSAPVWAAIVTAADQLRAAAGKSRLAAGSAQAAIYRSAPALDDISTGPPNGSCPAVCTAHPGYDLVTGLGSPRAGLDRVLLGQK